MDVKLHTPGYRRPTPAGPPPPQTRDRMGPHRQGSPTGSPPPPEEPAASSSAATDSFLLLADDGENQLDFFRKLGYSAAQVRAVMHKFGADTDRVLGELVRTGASPEAHEEEPWLSGTSGGGAEPGSRRGGGAEPGSRRGGGADPGSRRSCGGGGGGRDPEGGPELQEEGGENLAEALRPIVIDGSNVAMR